MAETHYQPANGNQDFSTGSANDGERRASIARSPCVSESNVNVGGGARTYKEMLNILKGIDKESDDLGEKIVGLHLQFADLLVKSAVLIDPELVKIIHDCEDHLGDVGSVRVNSNDKQGDKDKTTDVSSEPTGNQMNV